MKQETDLVRSALWKKSFSLGSRDRGMNTASRTLRRKIPQWAPWLRLADDGRQAEERFKINRGEFGGSIFRMWGGIEASLGRLAFQEVGWFSSLDFPRNLSLGLHTIYKCRPLCPDIAITDVQSHAPSSRFAPGGPLCICANLWKLILYYQERPSDSSFKKKKKSKTVPDTKANALAGL